ncbi:MAG: hypothetical protein GWP08_07235 [Nitrospiraceae bacterium]|nr:hypothetical protein [Nitrospiraceae bacterium]
MKARILKSHRGPGGSYELGQNLSEVSFMEIVLAVDGPSPFLYCSLGMRCEAASDSTDLSECATCPM